MYEGTIDFALWFKKLPCPGDLHAAGPQCPRRFQTYGVSQLMICGVPVHRHFTTQPRGAVSVDVPLNDLRRAGTYGFYHTTARRH